MYGFLADVVLIVHFAFVLFVIFGGVLMLKWRWIPLLHIPSAAWGVAIEFGGWICPLTPLENHLRQRAGETPYTGDFVARYLMPVIYPEDLTREIQIGLGFAALTFNLTVYVLVLRRRRLWQAAAVRSSNG